MKNFWEIAIKPSIEQLAPTHIIEIGSDKGFNTRKVLSYCIENNCRFTAIDPFPQFDYQTMEKESNGLFKMVTDLSLNVLKDLEPADVALIDGDHNWYTVYNELDQIFANRKADKTLPVCFFHDTGWPYARRDMYYNPENIPKSHIKPHAKGGMFITNPELFNIGFNNNLYNALTEGGEKNGVLTAIEDFVSDSSHNLTLYSFDGLHGLSILFEGTEQNHQIFSPFDIQKKIALLTEYHRLGQFYQVR
ncbi:hypothetical protein A1D22_07215 [Pasteurellaceae bacterium LFhippo2]|nr:hypothetical protein [Pasteurellaceae bacterium LFhippo2]